MKITVENLSGIMGLEPQLLPDLVERAKERNWLAFFHCIQTPFRFDVLYAVQENLNDVEFWQSFRSIWMHVLNLWEDLEVLDELLRLQRPHRHYLMDESERAAFDKLPSSLQIYRGAPEEHPLGFSWSLSKRKATWYAKKRQWYREACCVEAECKKTDVIALILARNENEIIIDPARVTVRRRVPVKAEPHEAWMNTKRRTLKMQELAAQTWKAQDYQRRA